MDRQLGAVAPTGSEWRDGAISVREATRQGLALDAVAARTGIPSGVLHRWLVALAVYESLDMSAVGDGARQFLEQEDAIEILYALRHLPRDTRSGAARYLLEHRLPAAAADGLIQAIKDCRRLGVREGFTCDPGNALAYRKWQAARHSTLEGDRLSYLREGLALAETRAVKALFEQALSREQGSASPSRDRTGSIRRLDLPVRWVGAGDPWPRLMPYCDDPRDLGRTPMRTMPPERVEGLPCLWCDLPAGRYIAVPGWPEVTGLERPAAMRCAASAIPLLPGMCTAEGDALLLVLETRYGEPPAGAALLERQGEGVRAVVVGAGEHPQPDAILGRIALVVRDMVNGPHPLSPVDEADDEDGLA